jgi:hypothetical protein
MSHDESDAAAFLALHVIETFIASILVCVASWLFLHPLPFLRESGALDHYMYQLVKESNHEDNHYLSFLLNAHPGEGC